MVSLAYSDPQNLCLVTGVTADKKFHLPPGNLPLELLNRYKNGWEVMGACNANDTMLPWSDQLLLAAENHHFEGGTHLKGE